VIHDMYIFRFVRHQNVVWAQNYIRWAESCPLLFVSRVANGSCHSHSLTAPSKPLLLSVNKALYLIYAANGNRDSKLR